jgi:hypothetical protein
MGLACGAAFIAMETFFEYYTNQIQRVSQATRSDSLGFLFGLQLLIPRTLQSLAGHMGWSAIVGYFVGLAFVRRRVMLPLILGGLVAASLVHGLWNSVGYVSAYLYYAVALAGFLLFLACLMKAKQLEPSFTGHAIASTGSIVVGVGPAPATRVAAPPPRPMPVPPPRPAPQPAAAAPVPPPMPVAPPAGAAPPPPRPTSAPAPVATAPAAPTVAAPARAAYVLLVGGEAVPLESGARIDLGALPALGGRGAGVVGEVTTHPSDPTILGFRNCGSEPWRAISADGLAQEVPPQRNLRVAAGTRISFGTVAGAIQLNQTP